MKKSLSVLLAILIFTAIIPTAFSASNDSPAAYSGEAEIFFINEEYAGYLSIPSGIPQLYQIPLKNATYKADSDNISVDSSGLVKPKGQNVYVIGVGNMVEYEAGNYTVTATYRGTAYTYLIKVTDYAKYYAHQVADNYLTNNITGSMSDEEKVETVCRFVAGYDYSVYHSSMVDMIVSGEGGDCWASTDTVNYMCKKIGFKSRGRNAANDPGAGSGHRNSVVQTTDGSLYMVECGYYENAPRRYSVDRISVKFKYSTLSDGSLKLTEYLGFDNNITVPGKIDELNVSVLGNGIFYNANSYIENSITSVTLPNTIKTIEMNAFYGLDKLLSVNIPASVTDIDSTAFLGCDNLKMNIDSGNNKYRYEDGILYTKDKTKLLTAVAFNEKIYVTQNGWNYVKKSFSVPDGVEFIEDFAFYGCGSLKSITFPDTLKNIGYAAFYCCGFENTVILPASLEGIGYGAFHGSGVRTVVCKSNDVIINNTTENSLNEKEDGYTLGGGYGYTVTIVAPKGSTAEVYVNNYGSGSSSSGAYTRYVFVEYEPGNDYNNNNNNNDNNDNSDDNGNTNDSGANNDNDTDLPGTDTNKIISVLKKIWNIIKKILPVIIKLFKIVINAVR